MRDIIDTVIFAPFILIMIIRGMILGTYLYYTKTKNPFELKNIIQEDTSKIFQKTKETRYILSALVWALIISLIMLIIK